MNAVWSIHIFQDMDSGKRRLQQQIGLWNHYSWWSMWHEASAVSTWAALLLSAGVSVSVHLGQDS